MNPLARKLSLYEVVISLSLVVLGALTWIRGSLGLAALVLSQPVLVVVHEAAHAVAGHLVGHEPMLVRLFHGRRRRRLLVGRTRVSIGTKIFTGGATYSLQTGGPGWRRRKTITLAAGPASTTVALGIAAGLWARGITPSLAAGAAAGALLLLISSMLPQRQNATGFGGCSDGLALWRLRRRDVPSDDTITAQNALVLAEVHRDAGELAAAACLLDQAAEPLADSVLHAAASDLALAAGDYEQARRSSDCALAGATGEGWSPAVRSRLHNSRAWLELVDRAHGSTEAAAAHAERAVAALADIDAAPGADLLDTLAWIDLRVGRPEQAHARFSEAWPYTSAGEARAVVGTGLSIASEQLGDAELSAAWARAAAGQRCDHTPVVPAIETGPPSAPSPPAPHVRTDLDGRALRGDLPAPVRSSRQEQPELLPPPGGLRWLVWFVPAAVSGTVAGLLLALALFVPDEQLGSSGTHIVEVAGLLAVAFGFLTVRSHARHRRAPATAPDDLTRPAVSAP